MSTALRTENLSRSFGALAAVSDVSFSLPQGARHALIGPNGAGKTTFINLLAGALAPSRGDVYIGEERVTALRQHRRVKLGLTRTFQISQLFPNLTVSAGYPRWVIHDNRFSGGGISSSIDLALEIVNQLSGPTQSMTTQLSIQYAPDPPFHSGDPSQAPPEVTAAVLKDQASFIADIRAGVEKVIGGE